MTTTTFDPQLHTLRTIASKISDRKQRQEAMSARYNLFAALVAGDNLAAIDWLTALKVALKAASPSLDSEALATAERAMEAIREGISLGKEAGTSDALFVVTVFVGLAVGWAVGSSGLIP